MRLALELFAFIFVASIIPVIPTLLAIWYDRRRALRKQAIGTARTQKEGFAHDQPISAKEDMNGLIDHEWIRKTRAGIPIVHDDPECAAHRCSAYNPIRGKDIEGCFCSCHLPLTPAAALGTAKGIIAEEQANFIVN